MQYVYYRLDPKYLQEKYKLESTLQDFFYGYQTFINPEKKYIIKNIPPLINQDKDGYFYFWNKFLSLFSYASDHHRFTSQDIYIDHDVFLFNLPSKDTENSNNFYYTYGIYNSTNKVSAACFSLKKFEDFKYYFKVFFSCNDYIRKKPEKFEEFLLTEWIKSFMSDKNSEKLKKKIIKFSENKITLEKQKTFKNFILHYQTNFLYQFIIKNKDSIKIFLKEKFYIKTLHDLLKILKDLEKIYKDLKNEKISKSYFL